MISKGTTHNDGARLADYLTTSKEGECAELGSMRGFEATNIKDGFRDVQIMAGATKAEQPFFHVQVRNREGERLDRQQFEYAADRIERMLGLTGQPRAIAFHRDERTGDEHMHVAWSRIDQDTLKAKPLPFFKERLKKISRELELHFGLEPVINHREGNMWFGPTRAEHEQARRLGLDVHEVRNTIRDLWDRSDSGRSFQAALEDSGFALAHGERRDYIVIDPAGGTHALGKRILDMTAAKIRDRMSDISRDDLPSVEMARALMPEWSQERAPEKAKREEKTEPVWDRDAADRQWQDAVINAAIDKEKAERNYAEPGQGDRKKESQEEKERKAQARRQETNEKHWPVNLPERTEWVGFEKAAGDATTDHRTENLKGYTKRIYEASRQSDSAKAFAASLDEQGIMFARATKAEADRSQSEAAAARKIGRHAPRFAENEILIVTEPRHEYRRNDEMIVPSRLQKIDQSLAEKFVERLGHRVTLQGIDATLALSNDRVAQRRADRDVERMERATDIRDFSRNLPGKTVGHAGKAVRSLGKTVDVIGGALGAFLPKLTPEQIRDGRIAVARRAAQAEDAIDFQKYTADTAQQRRQQEDELEAARQRDRERERGGRDR